MFWYDGGIIKGEKLELTLNDPALLYGATVFTTLRVYHQSLADPLTNWQKHGDRLQQSLTAFAWPFPDWEKVKQGAEILAQYFPVLRITIFPDGKEWITGRSLPLNLAERQQAGIKAWIADQPQFIRSLPQYKTGNYLGAWLALQTAHKLDAQEAILINHQGHWLETTTGNLWGYQDGCWWTPSLDAGILPGIAREQILEGLHHQGIPVQENIWDDNFVQNLEAIAYSNSVVEIIPFSCIINSQTNLNCNHPSLAQLRFAFQLED